MESTFQSKFKHKIQFVDKRGLKELFKVQPDPYGNTSLPAQPVIQTRQSFSKNRSYDMESTKQMRSNSQSHSYEPIPNTTTLSMNVEMNRNKTLTNNLENSMKKKESVVMDSLNEYEVAYGSMKQRLKSKSEYTSMIDTGMSGLTRNPEIESLALKMRERQLEKFREANGPKYIDCMLDKHSELVKLIDIKNTASRLERERIGNMSERESSSQKTRIEMEGSNQIRFEKNKKKSFQKYYSFTEEQPHEAANLSKIIRLKRIEDIIAQTAKNKEKEESETGNKAPEVSNINSRKLYPQNRKNMHQQMTKMSKLLSAYEEDIKEKRDTHENIGRKYSEFGGSRSIDLRGLEKVNGRF